MARWTLWRPLAKGKEWFSYEFDHDGPAVYELGVTVRRGRVVETMYVGETSCESARMEQYACGTSHIEHFIRSALREGCTLHHRAIACLSKREAKRRQYELQARFEYPWNTIGQEDLFEDE